MESLPEFLTFSSEATPVEAGEATPVEASEATPVEASEAANDVVEFPLVKRPPLFDMTSFLADVYFLNYSKRKFVSAAIYKHFDYQPMVLLCRSGPQPQFVFIDGEGYWQLAEVTGVINHSLEHFGSTTNRSINLKDCGIWIKIKTVKGAPCVEIRNGFQRVLLNRDEWSAFVSTARAIQGHMNRLTAQRDYIVEHIKRVMENDDKVYVPPPQRMDEHLGNRLYDELCRYKCLRHVVD